MRGILSGLVCAVCLSGCASYRALMGKPNPALITIVPGSMASSLTQSCPKTAAKAYDSAFTPTPDQVGKLEKRWMECLSSPDIKPIDSYLRQYTGLQRKDTKTIYLNAVLQPEPIDEDDEVKPKPLAACDGDWMNFTVEYDVEADGFLPVKFNGPEFTPATNTCPVE